MPRPEAAAEDSAEAEAAVAEIIKAAEAAEAAGPGRRLWSRRL
jgi:hypothetical protein